MTNVELAWAAGFFEGEGTVRINNANGGNLGVLMVSTVNTDRQAIDWFDARWPGYCKPATGLRPDQKPAFVWVIAARRAAAFLEDIRPFLVRDHVKARVALALEFQAQKGPSGRHAGDEYREQQWVFYQQMRELNARGNHHL